MSRGLGVMGKTGRWRTALANKILASTKSMDKALIDESISPKIRQLLQHCGYEMSMKDLENVKMRRKTSS